MEIRVLQNFLAVAEVGNITNAANNIHMAQSSLSRQIRDLENEIGQPLFIRNSRSVTLTEAGHILRKRAHDIILLMDKTKHELNALNDEISGEIYIGAAESKLVSELHTVLKDLRVSYPNIHFTFSSGNSFSVEKNLDKGLIDFGIFLTPAECSKYETLYLPGHDVWGLYMRKDDPLCEKEFITPDDLPGLPLLVSRQLMSACEGSFFTQWLGDHSVNELNIISYYDLVRNMALMVNQQMGYLLSIDYIVNTSESSIFTFRPLSPQLETRAIIAWRKTQYFSKPAFQLKNMLLERFSNAE